MSAKACVPQYNESYQMSAANVLIRGKQGGMPLLEVKLLRLMIMQVVREDVDLKTYKCRVVDLAKFLNIPTGNIRRDIKQLCKDLMQEVVEIQKTKEGSTKSVGWKLIHWVDTADYENENGTLIIKLSDDLKPYILDLNSKFTQYQFCEILSLSSVYAIRFYELICSFADMILAQSEADPFVFTIDYLREFFNCKEKYPNNGNFIIRVIDAALEEINKKTNTLLSYKRVKEGRKITAISVRVTTNIGVLLGRDNEWGGEPNA